MTTREYFQTVLDAHISDEIDEASRILIGKLDAKNAHRKTTPTKEQKEAAVRRQSVMDFFYDHQDQVFTRDQIAEALGISPSQVTAACKPLVAENMVVKTEAKVGKTRKMVYHMPREN